MEPETDQQGSLHSLAAGDALQPRPFHLLVRGLLGGCRMMLSTSVSSLPSDSADQGLERCQVWLKGNARGMGDAHGWQQGLASPQKHSATPSDFTLFASFVHVDLSLLNGEGGRVREGGHWAPRLAQAQLPAHKERVSS